MLLTVNLSDGATVADAIEASRIARQFPEEDLDVLQSGLWGQPVARDTAGQGR